MFGFLSGANPSMLLRNPHRVSLCMWLSDAIDILWTFRRKSHEVILNTCPQSSPQHPMNWHGPPSSIISLDGCKSKSDAPPARSNLVGAVSCKPGMGTAHTVYDLFRMASHTLRPMLWRICIHVSDYRDMQLQVQSTP